MGFNKSGAAGARKYSTYSAFPTTGNGDGDLAIALDTDKLYAWSTSGARWNEIDVNLLTNITVLQNLSDNAGALNYKGAAVGSSSGMNHKGTWSNTTSYNSQDVVEYQSNSYVCTSASSAGILPTNTSFWTQLGTTSPGATINDASVSTTTTYSSSKVDSTYSKGLGSKLVDETNLVDGTTPVYRTAKGKYDLETVVTTTTSGGTSGAGISQTSGITMNSGDELLINHQSISNNKLLAQLFEQIAGTNNVVNNSINFKTSTNYTYSDANAETNYNAARIKNIGAAASVPSAVALSGATTSYISLGNPASLSSAFAKLTIEAWVWVNAVSGTQCICSKWYDGSGARPVLVEIQSDGSVVFGINNTTTCVSPAGMFTANSLHHVACVFDGTVGGGTANLYIDGILQKTITGIGSTLQTNTQSWNWGRDPNPPEFPLNGSLTEMRMWNTARSQYQVQSNMNNRLVGTEPGLIGLWKTTENTGTTIADSTSNANTGTLNSATWDTTAAHLPALKNSSYTTNVWEFVTTQDGSRFPLALASKVNSVSLTGDTPTANTTVLMYLSFDGRATWKYYSAGAWQTEASPSANIATTGMTPANLSTALANYTPGGSDVGLDFMIGLKTTDAGYTPALVGPISINYNEQSTYQPNPSVGKYGGTNDYYFKRANATQSYLKRNATGSATILLNIYG